MSPAVWSRQPAHLSLWRRFHEALQRDAGRLSRLLAERPDIDRRELTPWWEQFASAVTQCRLIVAGLYGSVGAVRSDGDTHELASLLRETVEMLGLAVNGGSATSTTRGKGGVSASSDRADLARTARNLAQLHETASVAYLSRTTPPDVYRDWERRAIARLTYRNVAFLGPWLLDGIGTAARDTLWRDVPHLRVMRCDDAWTRRYDHVTAILRRPGTAVEASRADRWH